MTPETDTRPLHAWPHVLRPRCQTHMNAPEAPRLCALCQRIAVEADLMTRVVDAALAAGYELNTDNGGDEPELPKFTTDRKTILDAVMQTDDEYLILRKKPYGPNPIGWVRMVYGNDGWDVICDYTTNLESLLAPINEYAETLDAR